MGLLSRVVVGIALALSPFCSSFAQKYPSGPIHLVVPYDPGGGVDILARLVAQHLTPVIGQSVVVENRPGAGGIVGSQYVAHSNPDGSTMLLVSRPAVVLAPLLMKNLTLNPLKDLAPVTLLANVPAILLVKPSSPINTIQQLIAMNKANPGKLTFSSSGIGGTAHLSALMLKVKAGIDALHVPYKGQGPATVAVMSGDVTMTFADVMSGIPFVKSGQLKAVALTTPGHVAALPGTPSIADNLPGYSVGVWYGIEVSGRTPKPIIDALNRALVKTLHSPEMVKALAAQSVEPIGDTPEQFQKFIDDEDTLWTNVFHDAGIKPE